MKVGTNILSLFFALVSHAFVPAVGSVASPEEEAREGRQLRRSGLNEPNPPQPAASDDICFKFEGANGVTCETISFYLQNPDLYSPGTTYSYNLSGLIGNSNPGHLDIGLTQNPVINQPGAGNYIFVAKFASPGHSEMFSTCLLDCVPGGPLPSSDDPPYCSDIPCNHGSPPTPDFLAIYLTGGCSDLPGDFCEGYNGEYCKTWQSDECGRSICQGDDFSSLTDCG